MYIFSGPSGVVRRFTFNFRCGASQVTQRAVPLNATQKAESQTLSQHQLCLLCLCTTLVAQKPLAEPDPRVMWMLVEAIRLRKMTKRTRFGMWLFVGLCFAADA